MLELPPLASPLVLSPVWPAPVAGPPHWPAKHNRQQQPIGAALLNIPRMGARGVMGGGWCLALAPSPAPHLASL